MNLAKREVQTNINSGRDKIVEARIKEAILSPYSFERKLNQVDDPINGKNQTKKEKIQNKEKLLREMEKNKNAILVRKQINVENPWIKVNYRKQWSQEQFWIQKKNNSFKISTLKPNNILNKNQLLLCQMNIPRNIKHTSFLSLQTNET
jgi:hypothetical protein